MGMPRHCVCIGPPYDSLWTVVTTINEDVGASRVAGCITGQVEVRALQFMNITFSAHRGLAFPDIPDLPGDVTANFGGNVARRNAICPCKLNPLHR